MRSSHRRLSGTAITSCVRDITSANKAPGGFGLGTISQTVTDFDAIKLNGWYWGAAGTAHGPDSENGWSVCVTNLSHDSVICIQDAYALTNVNAYLHRRRLVYVDTATQDNPWEWVDPPMYLGTEYRTTERYLGKSVYVKLVDLGEGTNGKTINVGTMEMIRVECRATYSGWSLPMPELPFGSTDKSLEHTNAQAFYSNANTVTIIKGSTCPAFTATAKVYYIKSAD